MMTKTYPIYVGVRSPISAEALRAGETLRTQRERHYDFSIANIQTKMK